jgi:hypothetical protein
MANKLDARQTIVRDLLSHIGDGNTNVEVDNLMRAINSDLYPLLRLDSDGALTVTVQASSKVNPEYGRKTEIPPINGVVPDFTSGTIVFPATNAGSIGCTPGDPVSLSGLLSANNFIKVGVHLQENGDLAVTLGTEGASAAAAGEADDLPDALYIGKITISCDGLGNINSIAQGDVAQFPVANQSSAFSSIQDRGAKLIDGGTWNWDQNGANPDQLSWDSNAYIQIPGMDDTYNRILAGNVTISNSGDVAYVQLNRTNLTATNLTVQISNIDTLVPDNNTFIIARRLGTAMYLGDGFRLEGDEYVKLDGAIREISNRLNQLDIKADPLNDDQVTISGSDIDQDDGRTMVQELNNNIIGFTGATINFTTGTISGDATGIDFTPYAIPVGEYFWYGVSMSGDSVDAGNKLKMLVNVNLATASNAVAANAPMPLVTGNKKIGAVRIYNNAGIIQVDKVLSFGADISGPDGSGPIITADPASGFSMAFTDDFVVGTESTESFVRDGETNARHNLAKEIYELKCEAISATAVVAANVVIAAAPAFTVQAGDIIYLDDVNDWRRIINVNSQTDFDVDVAFGALPPGPNAGIVSQAVWSKELIQRSGDATQSTRPMDFFPAEEIPVVQIDYFDSLVVDDNVPDFVDQARCVVSVSNSGAQGDPDASVPASDGFTTFYERPQAPDQLQNYELEANPTKERLFAVFFANPGNAAAIAAGQVNLIKYKASFYQQDGLVRTGGILDSAHCMADGSSTEINCQAPTNEANSLLTLDFQYSQALNFGETQGDLTVVVDGEQIPRFVSGGTTDKYYTEEPGNNKALRFWTNVTLLGPVNIEVYRRQGTIDTANENTIDLGYLQSSRHINFSTVLPRLKFQRILTDSSGGAISVSLPTSPEVGDRVVIQDATASALSFNVTVDRNGELIEGVAGNDIINVNREWVEYEYYGGSQGWIVRR